MRRYVSSLLALSALAISGSVFWGEGSYATLVARRRTLANEKARTLRLESEVKELKSRIAGVLRDDRYLERAARDGLGLARNDDLVFVFKGGPAERRDGELGGIEVR